MASQGGPGLLRTLRTFAYEETTCGLVLCQMTAFLVLDPLLDKKVKATMASSSLPLGYLSSNAIQYIEFVSYRLLYVCICVYTYIPHINVYIYKYIYIYVQYVIIMIMIIVMNMILIITILTEY